MKLEDLEKKYEELGQEIERLKKKEKKENIDWSKVPVDQPVLVRDGPDENWKKRFFACPGGAWDNGCTSRAGAWTISFQEMKLDPDAEPILNWHPWHGGKRPVDENLHIAYMMRNGEWAIDRAGSLHWSHDDLECDIIWYAIVTPSHLPGV